MFLNGIHVPGILSLKTLIAKMVGIVFTIAGGIIAGKEGPFIPPGPSLPPAS
jgi:chloride channel 7